MTALAPAARADATDNLSALRETMGVMQHHDAVTGTEKQHVADDYARLLHEAITACEVNVGETLNQLTVARDNLLDDKAPAYEFEFESCLELNISACDASENSKKLMVTVYNPLSHATYQYVRVPVSSGEYIVMDYRNVSVESQIVPIPDEVLALPFRKSNAMYEIVFLATEVPPLGYKSYFIEPKKTLRDPEVLLVLDAEMQGDQPFEEVKEPTVIGNKYLNVSFDEAGMLKSIKGNGVDLPITQNFFIYTAASGNNNSFKNRSSGAYIFRPNVKRAERVVQKAMLRVVRGSAVDEVHQRFNDWISQVVRVYKAERYVEFEWLVGEIPVGDKIGREIVSRFDTNIRSGDVFFTDSNGREMLKRRRNHRETWHVELLEEVAGNYYPVTTKIAIEDKESRLAVLTDRAQGGSSLQNGSVELMVTRSPPKNEWPKLSYLY